MSSNNSNQLKRQVDVRPLAPMYRHQTIFDAFAALGPGEVFELVNDHDPKLSTQAEALAEEGQPANPQVLSVC